MRSNRFLFVWAVGLLILSAILLTLPGSTFPKANWYNKIWLDKWIHIGLFGLLVISWCKAFSRQRGFVNQFKKIFLFVAVTGIAYGVGMELVQKYCVPNRSFDGGDILADAAGCVLGFVYSTGRYIKK